MARLRAHDRASGRSVWGTVCERRISLWKMRRVCVTCSRCSARVELASSPRAAISASALGLQGRLRKCLVLRPSSPHPVRMAFNLSLRAVHRHGCKSLTEPSYLRRSSGTGVGGTENQAENNAPEVTWWRFLGPLSAPLPLAPRGGNQGGNLPPEPRHQSGRPLPVQSFPWPDTTYLTLCNLRIPGPRRPR